MLSGALGLNNGCIAENELVATIAPQRQRHRCFSGEHRKVVKEYMQGKQLSFVVAALGGGFLGGLLGAKVTVAISGENGAEETTLATLIALL